RRELGRGVTAAGGGDARVGAEQVRSIDQSRDGVERSGGRVVPPAAQVVRRRAAGEGAGAGRGRRHRVGTGTGRNSLSVALARATSRIARPRGRSPSARACTRRFPRAVASSGPATTRRPPASAGSWFKSR